MVPLHRIACKGYAHFTVVDAPSKRNTLPIRRKRNRGVRITSPTSQHYSPGASFLIRLWELSDLVASLEASERGLERAA